MNSSITIDLPLAVRKTLGKVALEDGVSENALATKALQDYLFLRRFRSLRERLQVASDKTFTDEEVFELVS